LIVECDARDRRIATVAVRRDLTVQLTGHDFLKSLGISLIPATVPDFFTEDTPTAVLFGRCWAQ
jgi:hypothetical protein